MAQIRITCGNKTLVTDYSEDVQKVIQAYKDIDEVRVSLDVETFDVSESCFKELDALCNKPK